MGKIDKRWVSQASPYQKNKYPSSNALINKFTHTNKGVGMWWKVRFPINHNFSKIRIRNRADCCGERLGSTKVFVSGQLCGTLPSKTVRGQWYEVTCNLTGNEIKLVTTQNTFLSIQGFEAYAGQTAPHVASAQHLVKIDKRWVSQASPYQKNKYPSSNAL